MYERLGRDYYEALAGCWREEVAPRPPVSDQLFVPARELGELSLIGRACGGTSPPAHRRAVERLVREQRALLFLREQEISSLVAHFRAAGIEPILVKGWSIGRKYADPAVRPVGDIDLAVESGQLSAALAALRTAPVDRTLVDLHAGLPDVAGQSWADVFARSEIVPLRGGSVRVLGPADELRQLCFHFWRHCGCRAKWVCDVAAAVEAYPADAPLDWLFGREWDAKVCRAVVGLAHDLVGAQVASTAATTPTSAPTWLLRHVLCQQGRQIIRAGDGTLDDKPLRSGIRRLISSDPMRTVQRARLSPFSGLTTIHAAGQMIRPLQWAVRAGRLFGRGRRQTAPQLHDDRIF